MTQTKEDLRLALLDFAGGDPRSQATFEEILHVIISRDETLGARSSVHELTKMLARFIDEAVPS